MLSCRLSLKNICSWRCGHNKHGVSCLTSTIGWSPFLGPKARALTNRTFERTQQRLERDRYIVSGLSGCVYCHSPHDWTAPGMPIMAGKEASGGVLPYAGLPGRIVAPNLTPRSGNRSGQLD